MKALLAIDGSHESEMAIETAASLTWPPDSRLEIISVVPTEVEVFGGPFVVGVDVQAPEVQERLVDDCPPPGRRGGRAAAPAGSGRSPSASSKAGRPRSSSKRPSARPRS